MGRSWSIVCTVRGLWGRCQQQHMQDLMPVPIPFLDLAQDPPFAP